MNLRSDDHAATADFLRDLEGYAKGAAPSRAGMVHDGRNGDGTTWRLLAPGSDHDYEAHAGDLWRNSAVAACLRILKVNFPEPTLEVATRDAEGNEVPVAGHELPELIDRPNDFYDGSALWGATVLSLKVDGNAYWLKVYSPVGKLVQLWWVPSWAITPVWPRDGSEFISAYRYEINGRYRYLDPSDVVHFRAGIDPRNDRLGLADLKAALREVCTDNEVAVYVASLLRNLGVPTVVITPVEAGGTFGDGMADSIRGQWRQRFTGENRGDPLVTDTMKVEKLGLSPKEMDLGALPDRVEDRICATTGVPAMLAGLTSGASHKTYANYGEARKSLYEDTIIPEQKGVARTLTHKVLCDFLAPPKAFVRWNYRGIACLRESEDSLAKRAGELYHDKGVIKRGEARTMIGLKATPEDDFYYDEIAAADAPQLEDDPEGEREDDDDPFSGVKDLHGGRAGGGDELPNGRPIASRLRGWFALQAEQILGTIPTIGTELPSHFPSLADYDDPISRAMTPLISAYWRRAGEVTTGRLEARTGLDLDAWEVTNPRLAEQIRRQTLAFCATTNATTKLRLDDALARLREELHAGLVDRGESIPELRKRVQSVFTEASDSRAETIARTEACRAVHAAQLAADEQSGVVAGLKWLLSDDACPLCQAQAGRCVRLGEAFATGQGDHPDYSTVRHPPLHPNDRCTVVEILKPEYGGPADVPWGEPAAPPTPAPKATGLAVDKALATAGTAVAVGLAARRIAPEAIALVDRLRRSWAESRGRVEAGATPRPYTDEAVPSTGPIADRIAAYLRGDGGRRVEAIAAIPGEIEARRLRAEADRAAVEKEFRALARSKSPGQHALDEAQARFTEAQGRAELYRDAVRATPALAAEVLALKPGVSPIPIASTIREGHPAEQAVKAAEGFLRATVAADSGLPRGLKVKYAKLRRATERAYYQPANRTVWLSGAEPTRVVAHELGHAIEMQCPGVLKLCDEFLAHRVGDEPLKKLADLFPLSGYDPHEKGRSDKFKDVFGERGAYYVGKSYTLGGKTAATEVLSMGIEQMLADPVAFATKDTEYFGFISGVMEGVFR